MRPHSPQGLPWEEQDLSLGAAGLAGVTLQLDGGGPWPRLSGTRSWSLRVRASAGGAVG